MENHYLEAVRPFETLLDFFRFAISTAHQAELYYGHGTDHAEMEMRVLLWRSLQLPYDSEIPFEQARLTLAEKDWLSLQLTKRIIHRIPVPYLIHEAYFCGYPFYVDTRVLIPRSPIAELIEAQFTPWLDPNSVHRILDVCTGSGCIAIACALAFPDAEVDAVDISSDALAVAALNRKRYDLEDTVHLIQSDCLTHVPAVHYDLIVSNPPYVSAEEMATLPIEYTHEPVLALQADDHGLAIAKRLLKDAGRYLSDRGILVLEVGNSADALMKAYPHVPFVWLDFERGGEGVLMLTADVLTRYFGG